MRRLFSKTIQSSTFVNKNRKIFETIIISILLLSFPIPCLSFIDYNTGINQVKQYIEKGELQKAEQILRILNEEYPDNSEILYILASILFWQKKYNESIEFYTKLYNIIKDEKIKNEIEKVKAYSLLEEAQRLILSGQDKKAKEILLELFNSEKLTYESGYQLGMLYFKNREYEEASKVFEKLKKLYPEDVGFHIIYIESLILSNYTEKAKDEITYLPENIKQYLKEHREDLFYRVRKNYFSTGYGYYDLSSNRASEKEISVELSQQYKNLTFLLNITNYQRYGMHDYQLTLDIYSKLWKQTWGYLSLAFSPDAKFLPQNSFGGEIFQGYKSIEFSLGYRRMNFKNNSVDIFFPGINLYLTDFLRFEQKFYFVPETNAYSLVSKIYFEPTFKIKGNYTFGFGRASERISEFRDIERYNTYFHKIELQYRFKPEISIGEEITYESREIYKRKGAKIFIKYWW